MRQLDTVWVRQIMTTIFGIVAAATLLAAMFASPASATIATEPGATFDGGICWEADGTEGIAAIDGSCVTPADYDAIFSYQALAATPNHGPSGLTVAEAYSITPDSPKASERPRSFMGTAEPTFVEYVALLHGRPVL